MRIRVPDFAVRAWDAFGDWANVPIYRRGRIEVRRIDVLLVLFGVGCAVYYAVIYNWQTAVIGVLTYVAVIMMVAWMF